MQEMQAISELKTEVNMQTCDNYFRYQKITSEIEKEKKLMPLSEIWKEKCVDYGIPERHIDCSFKNYVVKTENMKIVVEKLKSIINQGIPKFPILIHGAPGTGKTHLAISFLKASMIYRQRFFFTGWVDSIEEIKRAQFSEYGAECALWRYTKKHLLCIDDLGTEKVTEFVNEKLYWLVNFRYVNKLPLIVTSNLEPNEICDKYRVSTLSRLANGIVIKCDGEDYRVSNRSIV